jgi:hypothetical protein
MFAIRYFFREHDKFNILELPTAESLAKHLRSAFRVIDYLDVNGERETENGEPETGNPYCAFASGFAMLSA